MMKGCVTKTDIQSCTKGRWSDCEKVLRVGYWFQLICRGSICGKEGGDDG
jgi:hypothetical protein